MFWIKVSALAPRESVIIRLITHGLKLLYFNFDNISMYSMYETYKASLHIRLPEIYLE